MRDLAERCLTLPMSTQDRVAVSELRIEAPAADIFELIADPARQPEWDTNDNLGSAAEGQRVRAVGASFVTILSKGTVRESRVVEFEEARRIAWLPIDERTGSAPGHLWRYELEPLSDGTTLVRHTYDWTNLSDPRRLDRARLTTPDRLQASLKRLAEVAEAAAQRPSSPRGSGRACGEMNP